MYYIGIDIGGTNLKAGLGVLFCCLKTILHKQILEY